MKKLLLLAAFGSFGLMSAKDGRISTVTKTNLEIAVGKVSKTKLLKLKKMMPVTTSCGNTYNVDFPSSWSIQEIVSWVISFDSFDCG